MSQEVPAPDTTPEEGIPYGTQHEDFGHLHAIHPLKKPCPKCKAIHDHPYYITLSDGVRDCPVVSHITPAEVVNKLKVPSKNAQKKKEAESEW